MKGQVLARGLLLGASIHLAGDAAMSAVSLTVAVRNARKGVPLSPGNVALDLGNIVLGAVGAWACWTVWRGEQA